jgi:DNA invertase Pin-like site-specific DNA recombinase
MKTAISYLRFSSRRQSANDSYRRQIEATERFCKKNNLVLSERLEDLGISAWKGKNLSDESALGGFLKLVESGKVPKSTVLICENLDRLSRASILDALGLFSSILKKGVEIVTSMDGKWYSEKSITENPTDLMISIIYLTRGNNESEVKSQRVGESWIQRRNQIKNGEFAKFHCPSWLRHDGKQYELIKENAATIKLIFDLYLKGLGVYSLIKELNNRKIKSFTKSGEWKPIFIHRLLQNPAVIGTCESVSPPAKNYYPAAISEDVFYKALSQRQQNQNFKGKTGSKQINIFGGICKCHKCGGNMVKYSCKDRRTAKKYEFLICSKAKVGECKYEFTNFENFSYSFRSVMELTDFASFITPAAHGKDNSEVIRGKLVALQKTIERVSNAIVETDSQSLIQRLKLLEIERKQLETQYDQEKVAVMAKTDAAKDFRSIVFHLHTRMKNNEFRLQLRTFIRRHIERIVVRANGYQVIFKNHSKQIGVNLSDKDFELVVAGEQMRCEYEDFRYRPN